MRIEIAGFAFNTKPTSREGSIFMENLETGEGTEIDEKFLELELRMLFRKVM